LALRVGRGIVHQCVWFMFSVVFGGVAFAFLLACLLAGWLALLCFALSGVAFLCLLVCVLCFASHSFSLLLCFFASLRFAFALLCFALFSVFLACWLAGWFACFALRCLALLSFACLFACFALLRLAFLFFFASLRFALLCFDLFACLLLLLLLPAVVAAVVVCHSSSSVFFSVAFVNGSRLCPTVASCVCSCVFWSGTVGCHLFWPLLARCTRVGLERRPQTRSSFWGRLAVPKMDGKVALHMVARSRVSGCCSSRGLRGRIAFQRCGRAVARRRGQTRKRQRGP
jgi:hypothetical protein